MRRSQQSEESISRPGVLTRAEGRTNLMVYKKLVSVPSHATFDPKASRGGMMKKMTTLPALILLISATGLPAQQKQPVDFSNVKEQHEILRNAKQLQYEKALALAGDVRKTPAIGEDYDVFYYGLNLAIDHVALLLEGNVVMGAKTLTDGFSQVELDFFDDMDIDSVKWQGQNLAFTQLSETVQIDLPDTLSTGEEFFVNTYYSGTPQSYYFGAFSFDEHATGPIISTLSEPTYARAWWPCKDIPSDKADSADVWITVDSDLIATSEGTLTGVIDNGDGTTTYRWHEAYPITTYLVSLAISNYVTFADWYHTAAGDSMEVRYWVYPQDSADAEIDFSVTVPMMEAFVDVFEIEYPFLGEKYAMSAFEFGGAMEHQTNTSYGSWLIRGDHRYDLIVAHELAHQWWGDMVTCWDFINIWLNEGFAVYSEALWIEYNGGPLALRDYMLQIDVSSGNFDGPIYDPTETFNSTVYDKGAWALHMLRHIVGDSSFFDILYEWGTHPSYAYAAATTEDLIALCEDVSGMELQWYFDEFVYGENRPIYNYWWLKEENGGEWTVQLHIDQVQTNAPPFKMPIDIELELPSGDTTFVVWDSLPSQDFTITVPEEPAGLDFDPMAWVLKRAYEVPPTGIGGGEPSGSPVPMAFALSQNHPNPFNPRTTIDYTIGGPEEGRGAGAVPVRLGIYDTRGRLIVRLVEEEQEPGTYRVTWDGKDRAGLQAGSGIYFSVLEAGDFRATRKMVLLK